MSVILSLRRLVDLQQFNELNIAAQEYLSESGDLLAKPLLALSYAYLGNKKNCLTLTEEIEASIDDLDLDARVDLAAVYCMLGRIDDAVHLLESEQSALPPHALLLARLAWCRMVQGQTEQAVFLYQQSLELAPHRLPVWLALIGLYRQSEEAENAQAALNQAIEQFEKQYSELSESVALFFTAQFRRLQLEMWVAAGCEAQAEEWLNERREDIEEEEWTALVCGYARLLAGVDQHSAADDALREALQHYPHNLALVAQLAELAQVLGRTMQAMQLFRRACRIAKEQGKPEVGYLVSLSTTCLQHQPKRARKAAELAFRKAQDLTPGDDLPEEVIAHLRLQAKSAVAQVESQEQNFDRAETLFNEVLEENPHYVPALQALGQQQVQRGDIDTAITLFERVKKIDPVKGYSALINVRQFPQDEETLNRMEKAARQPGIEGSLKASLMLQVASAREKRKEYDAAFMLAREANNAYKPLLSYRPEKHRNQCARIRARFSKALYQHRRECGSDSSLPVFVLGMPRSGTTLVEQIIAGHSKIFGAGELGVIPGRIQGLSRWERHVGSGRTYPDCVDDITPYLSKKLADGIIDELKELAAEDKPDALHVVDKLPHNFENIGLIKLLFPNAKIISVRRDPRDIAISNYFTDFQAKHGGMGFAYDLTWIGEQLADHNLLMYHWHQVFPGEILEISYEDVVEDLEGSARKMLNYIGVEWEEQVLAFNELDRPVKTASVWQVRQPIYKTAKAKWMRYKSHLTPLINGTNAKIQPDEIDNMLSLPEPGFLQTGVDLFRDDQLDDAEMSFKKMLHHNPEHAAANYMVGLVYCRKGHIDMAVPLFEKALKTCPWQKEWRESLIHAYDETGQEDKAAGLREKKHRGSPAKDLEDESLRTN